MAVASFEALCAGFCEIAGVDTPALEADHRGWLAFHTVLHEITVDVIHRPRWDAGHALLVFDMGPLADDGSAAQAQLMALLDANFLRPQVHPPICARNPVTGGAVLQYVYPLSEATPSDLHQRIAAGIELVQAWRRSAALARPAATVQASHGPRMEEFA